MMNNMMLVLWAYRKYWQHRIHISLARIHPTECTTASVLTLHVLLAMIHSVYKTSCAFHGWSKIMYKAGDGIAYILYSDN